MKRLLWLLFVSMFVFAVAAPMRAQESAKKPAKEARWEGTVVRISLENSTLDVRQVGGNIAKTIHFDAATIFNSQLPDKPYANILLSELKVGDRVICLGTYDQKKELYANKITKRLSDSPK